MKRRYRKLLPLTDHYASLERYAVYCGANFDFEHDFRGAYPTLKEARIAMVKCLENWLYENVTPRKLNYYILDRQHQDVYTTVYGKWVGKGECPIDLNQTKLKLGVR